jgi:hypothetical protein
MAFLALHETVLLLNLCVGGFIRIQGFTKLQLLIFNS